MPGGCCKCMGHSDLGTVLRGRGDLGAARVGACRGWQCVEGRVLQGGETGGGCGWSEPVVM